MESSSRSPRNSPSLRLFWGIAPAPGLRSRIATWRPEVESMISGVRWVQPGDAHITLVFLGGRPESELDCILAAGRAAVASQTPFPLRTALLGGFPSARPSRVFCLGVEPDATLAAMAASLREAMAPFGYRPEVTPYRPWSFPKSKNQLKGSGPS